NRGFASFSIPACCIGTAHPTRSVNLVLSIGPLRYYRYYTPSKADQDSIHPSPFPVWASRAGQASYTCDSYLSQFPSHVSRGAPRRDSRPRGSVVCLGHDAPAGVHGAAVPRGTRRQAGTTGGRTARRPPGAHRAACPATGARDELWDAATAVPRGA